MPSSGTPPLVLFARACATSLVEVALCNATILMFETVLHSWHDTTLIQQEGVPISPKKSNLELSRSTSRRPSDSPRAAGTPHKRTMRRTASHLSPRKDQGEFLLLTMMAIVYSFETCTARTSEQTWQKLYFAFLYDRLATVWSA